MSLRLRWLGFIASSCLISSALAGDANEDWQKITALDAGPRVEFKSREEARVITLRHLVTQEKALRDFLADHPADPRGIDARLRLAHLLAARGDLQPSREAADVARQILNDLEKSAATPK